MAKFDFELEVQPRETLGKGASRRLRRCEDKVLGVVYGGNEKAQPITLAHHHVVKALENEAIYSHILTITSNGKKQKVVLKDIQRHPYKPRVMHMDFMRIDENKPITMHVPLHFLGQETAPGVVLGGGIVTHHMVELEIKCLPRDLPEFIEIDLTNAELDTVVHLSHVKLPKGVETTLVVHSAEDDLPVVSIHKPKRVEEVEESTEAAEGEEAASANGNGAKGK
ncbi:MAG: 50S ribosomal protein L25/general stress protein Ctc [Gammaproteobacteria bacterium 39-13]|nr:50S ribosomal protein L25/general stress protein Ctc [Gammaproteobacteria bacterium]OJV89814.1 MAG: 50S ribosomal protein L25/general stress protein Ctc [Gammaproteobacteria bacterium 39-13]